ncbi:MAG: hypothetical protein ACXAEU_03430 [Candidatus Hodarchaeales archaeon]|jgi:hypothetical protein
MDRQLVLRWVVIIVVFLLSLFLDWSWRRIIHVVTSFAWWGMVFFLVFILLPVINKMSPHTQHEIIGFVIPRIFRTASIAGFFSVGMGWRNALELANWDVMHFFSNTREMTLLFGGLLGTGLYLFHLFLERAEIELAMRASSSASLDLEDPEVKDLLKKIQIIPVVGFLIMSLSALTMFIH